MNDIERDLIANVLFKKTNGVDKDLFTYPPYVQFHWREEANELYENYKLVKYVLDRIK